MGSYNLLQGLISTVIIRVPPSMGPGAFPELLLRVRLAGARLRDRRGRNRFADSRRPV